MSTYSGRVTSARYLYRAAAEPGKATQLLVFILGMWYLTLGVLMHVFRLWFALYVLINKAALGLNSRKFGSGQNKGLFTPDAVGLSGRWKRGPRPLRSRSLFPQSGSFQRHMVKVEFSGRAHRVRPRSHRTRKHANLPANPLMLLASCVNTPIDYNVFHYLHTLVARCSASCVTRAAYTSSTQDA